MKVAVVTGGNKGIGYGIVKGLCAKFDGAVYLTSRDVGRGEAAVAELVKLGLNPKYHQLDVSDAASISKFRDYLQEQYGGLDVLVNNAAIAYKNAATEPFAEQAEMTVRCNFSDLLSVCRSLFPLLRPHGRVVNVSSSAGHLLRVPGDELRERLASPTLTEQELTELMQQFIDAAKRGDHSAAGWSNSAYSTSKVGVSALTFIQQRAFDADARADIIVNAVHPGYVDTDMTSHQGPLTIEEGADAPVYLALLPPNVESPRGCYVWYNREIVDWVKGPTPTVV